MTSIYAQIKKEFHSILSSCAFCESSWGKTHFFCKICWKNLIQLSSKKSSAFYPFLVNSLLTWNEKSDPYLRTLIYNLKTNDGSSISYHLHVIEKIAKELFLNFLKKDFWKNNLLKKNNFIFVPSPPRREGKKDQAWFLAYFLSCKMGGKIENLLLRKNNQGSQKNKNLLDRKKVFHQLVNPRWNPSSQKTYIFVDDVLTTGGTAEAAYKALKKPKNFLVWVMAKRPLLKIKEA